jgi:hypothetical protein
MQKPDLTHESDKQPINWAFVNENPILRAISYQSFVGGWRDGLVIGVLAGTAGSCIGGIILTLILWWLGVYS